MKIKSKLTLFALFPVLYWPASAQEKSVEAEKAEKKIQIEQISKWSSRVNSVFLDDVMSSRIGKKRRDEIEKLTQEILVPSGTKILPALITVGQVDHFIGGATYKITKFNPHTVILKNEPLNLLSTTEEFPDLIEKDLRYDARKTWLRWWVDGKEQSPKWFAERYKQWFSSRRLLKDVEAKAMYQKLLDIGVPALPLWLSKLPEKQSEGTRLEITKAISYLVDGAVKPGLSSQEYANWWKANSDRWTIPFPESKEAFVAWLEKEAFADDELSPACALTLSRVEDVSAIDALIRLLKHPRPEVRAVAIEQLQKLFGDQLPELYKLNIGTEKWETVSDLLELQKYESARQTLAAWRTKMQEQATAESAADDFAAWWNQNKATATIYWPRAWQSI